MLIGIDASRYGHETATGVERYSFYVINGLIEKASSQKKHKLILYSKNQLKLPPHLNCDPKFVKFKIIHRKRFWTQIGLAKEMKKNPPDILFVPSHTLPLIHPKKSVITIHDVAFKHLKKSYSMIQYLYLNWSTGFAVKNAQKIIVPSECTRSDLIHFYKCPREKTNVVYHGYEPLPDLYMNPSQEDDVLKRFWLQPRTKFIFFIGRLETKKNIENLLRAFAVFTKDHKDWKLLLCGKRGIGFNKIYGVANKLDIWENIVMPGYVTDVEKYVLFKYCKFFVFPSFYEGFGFPILEAFSHGKPVLTSRVSGIPEVASEAAYYTDPFDAGVMAKDMEKLAVSENLRKDLAEKGAERLKKFNWDDAVSKTWKILT